MSYSDLHAELSAQLDCIAVELVSLSLEHCGFVFHRFQLLTAVQRHVDILTDRALRRENTEQELVGWTRQPESLASLCACLTGSPASETPNSTARGS